MALFTDIATLFSTTEARIAATVVTVIVVGLVWAVSARLHEKDVEAVSGPFWHLAVTLLRLSTVLGGGVVLVGIWASSPAVGTFVSQYNVGSEMVVQAGLSVAFVVGAYIVTSVLARLTKEVASTRPEISDHQREIIYRISQVAVYLVVLVLILGVWRVDLGGFLVGAGFLGIVVGMAARQTLGAGIAGFVLMFSRPFEIGDWVEIGDHEGIVTDITVVNTRIQTFDGEYVMVPNDVVSSESLVNRSRKGRLRLEIEVGVDYGSDLQHAAEVAQEAVEELEEVLSVPKPQVVAKRFGDSSVVLGVRPWIDRPSARRRWRAQTAVIEAIHDAFAEEGITIPFPQRELSAREDSGPVSLTEPAFIGSEPNDRSSGGENR
ncbi:mechanosensitive ion channel family protein [Haloferax namakaokahaiae]|uniref:Mechanosensitive ion channel family protein n=1 Tax=Haloferax namakaokahaiae TaxID=1748331 RepID=A0ABD5ZA62_9EURY